MWVGGPTTVEVRTAPAGERFINVDQRVAGGDYFRAMEVPLRRGRLFNDQDTTAAPRVVLVDERMAQQLWPDADAIGKRIRTGGADASGAAPWATVVGVVGNVKQDALDTDSRMAMYLDQTQLTPRAINVVVRAAGDPAALTTAVRREL